jgi:hypothetical protein
MGKLRLFLRAIRRNERGQVLVLVGLLTTAIMGFTAVAVDVGSMTADKGDLQNAADAMALAAAADLPNASAATSAAHTWATKNGVDPSEIQSIQIQQQSLPSVPNPRVTVNLKRGHDFVFAKAIGVNSTDIEASASAIRTSFGGGDGIVPWTVTEVELHGVNPGDLAIMKYDAKDGENGNFGPISIDGTGASVYRESEKYGCQSTICSEVAVAQGCQENAPQCDGAECYTEPGNMTGPTRDGVDYRMNNTDSACDSFAEVFSSNDNGTYSIDQECNPFIEGSKPSLRVIIVPVIDELCDGRCLVTITEFALFFLEGYDEGKCSGNNCEIKGRFVKANITTGGLTGVYDPNSLISFVKLVQ